MDRKKITKAIVPVAGLGTRMLPATKEVPKELLLILNKPLIQHIVEEIADAGISDIIFVTRRGKASIQNYFSKNHELEEFLLSKKKNEILKNFPNNLHKKINFFTVFQENPLGLGHAILTTQKLIKDEPFAIFLPDEFLIPRSSKPDFKEMIKNYSLFGKYQILVEKVPKKLISQYGVIKLKKKNPTTKKPADILDIVEKPSRNIPSDYRVVGRYIMPANIFKYIKKTKPGKDKEVQLTDAIKIFLQENKEFFQATLSNSDIYDCGSFKGLLGANIALGLKNKEFENYIKDMVK